MTRLTVGDAAHNLRSALDHIAYTIVQAGGKDDPSFVYFPMGDSRESLVGSTHYRFIERVAPKAALEIADVIRPYKRGGDPRFWALNQLDKIDKHRLLVATAAEEHMRATIIRPEQENNPPPIPPGAIYLVGSKRTSPEGVVTDDRRATRPGSAAHIHNQANGYGAVEIVLRESGVFENKPIIPTLRELAELVSGVIDSLELLCFGKEPPPGQGS